jgi:hypothetical protein
LHKVALSYCSFSSFNPDEVPEEDLVELVIDSELKITDVEWSDNLTDPDSEMYLEMQNDLEEEMTAVFCDEENSTFAMVDNNTCSVEVTNFTEGSVNVMFSITKMDLNSTLQSKDDADILAEMEEKLNKKGMKKFKVDKKSLKISKHLALSVAPSGFQIDGFENYF